jgi:hypothetical protein
VEFLIPEQLHSMTQQSAWTKIEAMTGYDIIAKFDKGNIILYAKEMNELYEDKN